jgi:hypothetical protein
MMGVEGGAKAVPEANGVNGSAGIQQEHKDSPAVGADAGKQPKLMPTLRCPQLPAGELFVPEAVEAARPAGMDKAEWKARVELAALYRIFYARGWVGPGEALHVFVGSIMCSCGIPVSV